MKSTVFLSGALLCLLLTHQINAQCLCGAKGEDYCTCKNKCVSPNTIPRPPSLKLPPIGDSCWCGKQYVQPAIPPAPPCKAPPKKCPCSCSCPCHSEPLPPQNPCLAHAVGTPADALSVSLALRAEKALTVPEAKLSYGPVNTPLNGLRKIYFSNIPEEKMYALNSQVIELKRRIPIKEEIVEFEEDEEEEEEAHKLPCLTYQALGYKPEKFKNPKFIALNKPPALVLHPKPCGCPYKAGKVVAGPIIEDYAYATGCA